MTLRTYKRTDREAIIDILMSGQKGETTQEVHDLANYDLWALDKGKMIECELEYDRMGSLVVGINSDRFNKQIKKHLSDFGLAWEKSLYFNECAVGSFALDLPRYLVRKIEEETAGGYCFTTHLPEDFLRQWIGWDADGCNSPECCNN